MRVVLTVEDNEKNMKLARLAARLCGRHLHAHGDRTQTVIFLVLSRTDLGQRRAEKPRAIARPQYSRRPADPSRRDEEFHLLGFLPLPRLG